MTLGAEVLHGVPPGLDALLLAEHALKSAGLTVHIARDDVRLRLLAEQVAAFAPDLDVLTFPAWDCVPYDRVSPNAALTAERVATLGQLAQPLKEGQRRLLLTTVNAVLQRIAPLEALQGQGRTIRAGEEVALDDLTVFLSGKGYLRTEVVMEPGEFAVRGGLLDVFPTGSETPFRLDFFGDEVEEIRAFDPVSQRSADQVPDLSFLPMGEVVLTEDAIAAFRSRYREMFGAPSSDDALYAGISEGHRMAGMEHWLPLFYPQGLDSLFAAFGDTVALSADEDIDGAVQARLGQIADFYEARRVLDPASGGRKAPETSLSTGDAYHPVPPELLFLSQDELERGFGAVGLTRFSRYLSAEDGASDAQGRPGRDFADVRALPDSPLIPEVLAHIRGQSPRRVVVAAYSAGASTRMTGLLQGEAGNALAIHEQPGWSAAVTAPVGEISVVVLPLMNGFETEDLCVITEADIFGDRLVRAAKRAKRGDRIIADVSGIEDGDLLVHAEHGIGRYVGLRTLDVGGAAHDCLLLTYADDDRLYVPVENLDVLSRFGSEQAGVVLDRLGGTAWQARKAKLKQRMADMADHLIRIAAAREMKAADKLLPAQGTFEEFCARFPYHETEDQLGAIADTIDDLGKGRPMDRLVCGDVGFGKTEVALRAAFVAAMSGVQVAVVAPTTLLVRQHARTFAERFAGFGLKIGHLSRLVSAKDAKATREGIADGTVNIVVGTHALLAKSISFAALGLLIVDEEQHFGVAHKERLKELKSDVHVLTLTATPIPRTLQMALTGVRQLSIIATPPVDRLAVRTFVLPFDGVIIREALMRERFRGGQSFYVCPRVSDLDRVREGLERIAPELTCVVAHGQMSPSALEEVMTAFADGKYDVLLSTNIIESGLDLPRVNTIMMHRADMFGLAQLYQLRGRVGRGKERGYAYLTLPPGKTLTDAAKKRLDVMQSLDTLGAGFTLASHDLDIRGAGNLLGDEQSGHIKEVGIELYQHLLQEAVTTAREGAKQVDETAVADSFSPVINIGAAVLLPEGYVPDLGLRLSLYRQIADLASVDEIEGFAASLIDRFGPLPPEVDNLLTVVGIKVLCRAAHIEKVDAGPKGATIAFYKDTFPNPAALVGFISRQAGTVKIRADQRLVILRAWGEPAQRLEGLKGLIKQLADLASEDS